MLSSEIRRRYLDFFRKRGHTIVSSDLLVPSDDPTLLFTGAGMNQFKEQFMGRNITFRRAASCQKCLRTGDLENVGRTPRHHTFFEMLGNFSFGDYFKREAIIWAWEFMTREMNIPEEKLWVSVYKDDHESFSIWKDVIGVPEKKIVKLGMDTNFWPANAPKEGPNGPCGPCSEIFYDWGEGTGCGRKGCDPSCDCARFIEVWNLVFTEYDRKPDGSLKPLPSRNIDTGMGLERITSVMQGVKTNFQTDLFVPVIAEIKNEMGGKVLSESELNLIADHVRAAAFAITDGVSPSNEKRGYVVRKLIRRAWLKASFLEKPFLFKLVPSIVRMFKEVYPELEEKREHVCAIIEEEERRFGETLKTTIPVCEEMLSGGKCLLSGDEVFKLVDTYGLPVDVIREIADSRGVNLDIHGFERLMEKRREESRKGSNLSAEFIFEPDMFRGAPKPPYSEKYPLETELAYILKGGTNAAEISQGEQAEIITSPQCGELYSEGGGQVGDTGAITKEGGVLRILNTYDVDGRKVMVVYAEKGAFNKGDKIVLDIDRTRKQRTAMNHTATHLLQAALRQVLGSHVKQSGSLVDDRHLRFDFTHMKKLSDREIRKIEETVNRWIQESMPVCKETKSFKDAKQEGALSFFGDKYGDTVRMVSVSAVSKELCGGTHVDNTSEIGLMKITSETSVASGIRRIEAVTGDDAKEWLKGCLEDILEEYEKSVQDSDSDEVMRKIPELEAAVKRSRMILDGSAAVDLGAMHEFEDVIKPAFEKAKETIGKFAKLKSKAMEEGVFEGIKIALEGLIDRDVKVDGIRMITGVFHGVGMPVLRKALSFAGKKISSGVVLLGGSEEGRASLVCAVTQDLVAKGLTAKKIMEGIVSDIDGGGGGTDMFAQAGGRNPAGLDKAIEDAKGIISEKR